MRYQNITKARFLQRPNRFIALVETEAGEELVHVKNTGRCRELLVPGAAVYLEEGDRPGRKTRYDLVAVEKGERLINMDAQAPNRVFREWAEEGRFRPGLALLRPETTWGNSRFDFYWEAGGERGFVEVKGVTLEEDGAVYFPDAPTERGVKHVEELIRCREAGLQACLFLVVQMEGAAFWAPSDRPHPAFGGSVGEAAAQGVEIQAWDCRVAPDSLEIRAPVPVRL